MHVIISSHQGWRRWIFNVSCCIDCTCSANPMSVLPGHSIWMFSICNDSMSNVGNLEHMLFNWVRLVVLLVGKWEQVILSLSVEVFFFPSNQCEHLFFLWHCSESSQKARSYSCYSPQKKKKEQQRHRNLINWRHNILNYQCTWKIHSRMPFTLSESVRNLLLSC